jgi:hypothetical protein
MPQYEINVPGSGTYRVDSPSELTDAQVWQAVQGQISFPAAAQTKEAGFNLGDIAKSFGMGAVGSTKALTDVAGADNVVSSKLGDVSKSIQQSLSPERQAEMERQAARMKAAEESGSFLQEVKAGALNVAEAPLQSAAQAIGSFVPYLPALFAAPAAAAMRLSAGSQAAVRAVAQQAPKVIGTAQGAGAVKGSIYDGVLKAEIEAGADPEVAKKKADAAQSYFGGNFDQIALGAGLGYAAGSKGVEELFTKAGRDSAARGVTRRVGETVLKESLPEAAQGGQERVAQNVALQREGYDVGTFTGAAGAATQEALTGALGAAPIAAISGPGAQPAAPTTTPAAAPAAPAAPVAAAPSPTQAIEDQAAELERQQQRQEAAMERARAGGIGGGSEVNQTLLEQARIRKEQQERAAAAEEKAAEDERKKSLRAERVRIGSTQYSGDPMMNEVLRSRAIAEFDAANKPKVEAPKAPEYQPTKTIEQTTPIEQPKDFNVLRGVDARNTDLMSAMSERRAAEEAAAAAQTKQAEAQRAEQAAKTDTSRADVDQRVSEVENFLMSPVKKTQQETADYMAGVVPEMQKDFLALLDEDMSQPLTPEQTEALKTQIRQRMQPDLAPEEAVQRTPFKKFLASKGMNKKDVQDIFGENAYRANQQLPGAIRADAPRLDMLAEAAVEAGFLQEEDTEALVQMIKDEFGGDEQVAVDMAEDRAAAEYEAQRENELASRAGAIGLNTKGMKPEQIAARLDRIERKREEKRKQYNRSIDGFADLPTADQDRIIDMMIDQFGEPQVFDVERAEIEGRVREEEELLQTQTEKELRAKQAEIDRLAKENERLSKEAERKAKADEQVGGFVLTGSKRDADEAAARGQMDLAESKEASGGSEKETLDAKTEKGGWAIDPKEQRVEKELTGKSFMQVAQWAIDSAPNAFYRTIAEKVLMRLREYERKGVEFDFTLHTGASRPIGMKGRSGAVEFTWEKSGSAKNSKMEMHINGAAAIDNQAGYAPGVQYDTILHELLHAAIRTQTRFMPKTDPLYKELMALDDKVLSAFNEQAKAKTLPPVMMEYYRRENNILSTPDELISWGMTDKGVQDWLDSIKVGEKSILTKLVELMRKVLGLGKPYESAFEKLVRTTDSLLDVSVDTIEGSMSDAGFSLAKKQSKKPTTAPVQQSLFREVSEKKSTSPTPNQAAQANLEILDATGMQLQPPEPGRIQNIKDTLRKMGEDPALTKDSAKSAIKKFLDKMEVAAFSGDAAFNNDIRRNLEADFADNPDVLGMLLEASQSQAVHADALATQFIVDGGIFFDTETKKWVSIKKEDNFIKLAKQIEKAAEKYGLNKEQTEQIAHTYFVAKRFKDLLKKQNARDAEIDRLNAELDAENANIKQYKKDGDFEKLRTSERAKNDIKADIEKLEKAKVLISEDQRAMIEPGLSLVKNMPELEDISETWQGIRANAVKAMIDGNLWSLKYAEDMLDNAAYVPFYRDEQLDEGGGPQEFIKGLQVKAEEFRLKGSNAAVNDVFDNMVRWTQYAINRSVRNHKALQMVDLGTDLQVGDRKMAEKVKEMDPKKNTIRVFRDGKQEIYSMADPLYVDAFSAISNVTIPSLKFFTWFSNLLRQSVVLYPLFSVAQVPQDAISAMFTSGLKTRYALRIPVLAVKEFLKTLNKTSSTHNLLKSYGATGVRDFNATVARQDIQIAAGLKGAKGAVGKTVEMLSHIAMAADNSIRQAVYEASMQQGLSKGEAIEKAFDIINFRRRGTSKLVNLAGQTVPFFYAYMSVQRTAYKVLTGVGISPQKRKEALTTLATTSGAVMALSLFYVMMNGGDEEYEKTPTAIRDRTLNVPGTGGFRIPLRPDLFLMPKVLTEHLYHLITDTGFSDGAKFRKSVADGVANAVLSPQPIPQAVKPAIEVAINYDFFQGRPLIGQFEKQKEAERQFNDNTSEFSKLLGEFGVSPIAADHMIRGMFGSAGGLFLYTTNFIINSDPDVPRPDLSFRDALSALPGTSGFVTKASENALKTDFYALRDEVEKVKNTYNDIKTRSPQELEQFLSDEKNIARLGLAKGTEKIGMQLSKIRRAINQITNAPEDLYSASEKKDAIKELREVEKEMLKAVDIPALRKMAMM